MGSRAQMWCCAVAGDMTCPVLCVVCCAVSYLCAAGGLWAAAHHLCDSAVPGVCVGPQQCRAAGLVRQEGQVRHAAHRRAGVPVAAAAG
jgi:hypothetical protein